MSGHKKPRKRIRFKTKVYIGNESVRKEMMLKEAQQRADSLQKQVDSLKHENDSLKIVIKSK